MKRINPRRVVGRRADVGAARTEEKYHLKIKLPSGAEFEAEGSEEIVREFFDRFLRVVREFSAPPTNEGSSPAL